MKTQIEEAGSTNGADQENGRTEVSKQKLAGCWRIKNASAAACFTLLDLG